MNDGGYCLLARLTLIGERFSMRCRVAPGLAARFSLSTFLWFGRLPRWSLSYISVVGR